MIELHFPIKKTAKVYQVPVKVPSTPLSIYTPMEIAQAQLKKISPEEWRKRNAIIVEEAHNFFAKVGDTVYPSEKTDYEKFGAFIVIGICHSYKDFGDTEWPKSDNPLIVQIRQIDGKKTVLNATPSWLIKRNVHLCS